MGIHKNLFKKIELEDDSLREGLQSPIGRTLTFQECYDFIVKINDLNIDHFICGFPPASSYEYENVFSIIKQMETDGLKIKPWVLFRLCQDDLDLCIDLIRRLPGSHFGIAFFKAFSDERMTIEGWKMEDIKILLNRFMEKLAPYKNHLSFNLEDITRCSESRFEKIFSLIEEYQFYSLVLCDSVGVSLPRQAESIVKMAKERRPSEEKIVWHGHNDFGLAMANSLFAWYGGADIISGTFTGLGERAGNLPLEQMILVLNQKYGHSFNLSLAVECCEYLMKVLGFKIHGFVPVIGENCYKTQVGTHASAILKARILKKEDSETVYTPFDYSVLNKEMEILVGPQSGSSICKYKLMETGADPDSEMITELLGYAKQNGKCLNSMELFDWVKKRKK